MRTPAATIDQQPTTQTSNMTHPCAHVQERIPIQKLVCQVCNHTWRND